MLNYVWLILLFPLARGADQRHPGPLAGQARWWPSSPAWRWGPPLWWRCWSFSRCWACRPRPQTGGNGRERIIPLFTWIVSGDFVVEARILLDQLSILMVLVVTGVSTLIHIYSAGYMEGEEYHNRYFTWLNLFVFMMLILVLGDSFVTMYVGWEGVGLCSYLLIGYWFEREVGGRRGQESFIVNRVGDFGFALGILLIFATFGSVAFEDVFPAAQTHPARHGHGHRPAAVPGRHGQVGPDPAVRLVARRHGRPHAGQRPDPRGDDGHGRRLHGRPLPHALSRHRSRP